MTYGSLFTGIGGLDLGLDRAGLECRWQVEIDPYAVKVLERHWPHVTRYGDITKLSGDELEPVDLLCGGFPCQDLSQAGKQVGITGSRSGLWFEFARLVGVVRPRYVIVENVPGLLVPGAMRRVVGELARLRYVGIWRSLRASEFGASHLRKRVFIVAYRQDNGRCVRPRSDSIGLGLVSETGTGGNETVQCQSERRSGDLGDSERTRWTQTGTGRHEYAGPEPEEGMRELGVPCSESREDRHAQSSRPGLEQGLRGLPVFAPGPSDPRWPYILRERPDLAPALAQPSRGRRGGGEEPDLGETEGQPASQRNNLDRCGIGNGNGERETGDIAPPQSPLCRMVDGIPPSMDGDPMSNRTKRLGRLGNAVVPQIAEWIGDRIMEFERSYA